ncbi:MarR family transcriptional regulator [Oceaniradius stylonematis]|uniref:MarR family transcriptional regulator n=2 Tax=Oceaniradius stylonematis TaxID=2184161 RepID=A0A3A8AF37_9HYPH|nr:MarR family transcriptional regulator [Oceaniradius stylonematis]RNC93723.1 MAG: MarR family transcriptional regulator [Oricola sp.]
MDISMRARLSRENSMGWMIQRLARRLDDAMNARLAEHGLTLQQFAILMTVIEHGRMTQAEIGRLFAMPAYAISRAIDGLEADGLLVRDAHPSSRRAHQIHATEKALDMAPAMFAIVKAVNADLTQGLGDKEAGELRRLLATVVETAAI